MIKSFDGFISNAVRKTSRGVVKVIDYKGRISYVYEAPPGLQLDRFVQSLFPDAELMVSATKSEVCVSVIMPDDGEIFQIHHLIYEK